MKKAWWEYLNVLGFFIVFGGVFLVKRNLTAGVICMVLGILMTGTYLFIKFRKR